MKKGSITVFLSLTLALVFSFFLSTLEASRVVAAKSYLDMLSLAAGDSAKAMYYYPLFEDYSLLGILSDTDQGYFSENALSELVSENVKFGIENRRGGILQMEFGELKILSYETFLDADGKEFFRQVRTAAVVDEAEDLYRRLFEEQNLTGASAATRLCKKQEEVMEETATVVYAMLEIMEKTDGVEMGENGLLPDENGNLQGRAYYFKKFLTLDEAEWKEKCPNEEIRKIIMQKLYSPEQKAQELLLLLREKEDLKILLDVYDLMLAEEKTLLEELKRSLDASEEDAVEHETLKNQWREKKETYEIKSQERDELLEFYELVCMDAEDSYEQLRMEIEHMGFMWESLENELRDLEEKQLAAQAGLIVYENFLKDEIDGVSEEFQALLKKELQEMKIYAGMEEKGFVVSVMEQTRKANVKLLKECMLPDWSPDEAEKMSEALKVVRDRMPDYSVDGYWFDYGEIKVSQSTGVQVEEMIKTTASTAVTALFGLDAGKISTRKLQGEELPSAGLSSSMAENMAASYERITEAFSEDGFSGLLELGSEGLLNLLAAEVYQRNEFGCYGKELKQTKLCYEREYILFGETVDVYNFLQAILSIAAIRMVFTMASITQNAAKMAELEALAMAVAGMTGLPFLVTVVKYSILALWALEESVVETAALINGKRLSLQGGGGVILLPEVFLFSPALVSKKQESVTTAAWGLVYEDYLTVLSLLEPMKTKAYRCMDLIQENMRLRYNDVFRMRNVVTEFSFRSAANLKKKVGLPGMSGENYSLVSEFEMSY